MLSRDVCRQCYKNSGFLEIINKTYEDWYCVAIGSNRFIDFVHDNSDAPKNCPYKFEHSVFAGMKDAR